MSPSLQQMTQMIQDLKDEAAKVGLEIHPDKTKILHNNCGINARSKKQQAIVGNMTIDILDINKQFNKILGESAFIPGSSQDGDRK